MTLRKIKIIITVCFLLAFITSLTQDAIIVNYSNETKTQSSLLCLLMGSTAILGGGLLEWVIWLANPLSLVAIVKLWKSDKNAIIYSFGALILSGSFFFWKEILGSESGAMAKIISFEAGYYLWAASILVLNIGVIYYFFISKEKTEPEKVF